MTMHPKRKKDGQKRSAADGRHRIRQTPGERLCILSDQHDEAELLLDWSACALTKATHQERVSDGEKDEKVGIH